MPIVNGYSGYATPLLALLDSAASPLRRRRPLSGGGPDAPRARRPLRRSCIPATTTRLRSADGVPERTIRAFRASGQIAQGSGAAAGHRLRAGALEPPADATRGRANRRARADRVRVGVGRSSRRISSTAIPTRAGLRGSAARTARAGCACSWRSRPTSPASSCRSRSDRSTTTRAALRIEGEDAAGRTRTLYDGSPYAELAAALVRDGRYPEPRDRRSRTTTPSPLWIRQTAPSRASWSIHELRLWRR